EVDLTADGLKQMVAARSKRAGIRVHAVAWASVYQMNARLADRYCVERECEVPRCFDHATPRLCDQRKKSSNSNVG
ncbi:MAG TPA: hypothetical protein VFN67_03610, partial [Polyangiales bacterium]|nr:hypothetical protein [Polyangiales bacterium]